jgi:hypothetical protein
MVEYADVLDVPHQATFQVTYNTPTGQMVVGYVIISPAGTTGQNTTWFLIPNGYTFDHYEFIGSSEYVN